MARNSGVRVLPAELTISTALSTSSFRCLTTASGPWELGADVMYGKIVVDVFVGTLVMAG